MTSFLRITSEKKASMRELKDEQEDSSQISKQIDKMIKKHAKRSSSSSKLPTIGEPVNVQHHLHVDLNYTWTGEDPINAFKIVKQLGSGAYGSVYRASHKETGLTLAIKMVKTTGKKIRSDIEREIEVLKQCRHRNIVSYYGCCFTEHEVWILMDYCGIGSVFDLITEKENQRIRLNVKEDHVASIMASVIAGLEYLHKQGIIHRDIKSANILISDIGEAKIADFGVSSKLGQASNGLSVIGSPLWMAPEVIQGLSDADITSDIWSVGITAIEIIEGVPPHHNENIMRAMYKIGMSDPPTLKDSSSFSPAFQDFVHVCLNKNPSERPSASDLLKHPFIANAKPTKAVLVDVLTQFFELTEEERISTQLWHIVVTTDDLEHRTVVSPVLTCGQLAKKVSYRLYNTEDTENYGLYIKSEDLWLEDSRKLYYYKKYLKNVESVDQFFVVFKRRPESFRPDDRKASDEKTRERHDSKGEKKKQKERNDSMIESMKTLVAELTSALSEEREQKLKLEKQYTAAQQRIKELEEEIESYKSNRI